MKKDQLSNLMTEKEIITKLNMKEHPEGGYYVETYRSKITDLGEEFMTVIYFLLLPGQVSYWHKIAQDEMWFFHQGEPVDVYCISKEGVFSHLPLGLLGDTFDIPQQLVPAETVFGSKMRGNKGYSLVSCVVSPAFQFQDFKLFEREELVRLYPNLSEEIDVLKR